jgi:hypothetical protein
LDPDPRFHGLQVVKIWPGLEYFSEHNLFFFTLYKLNFFLILSFSWTLRYFCLSFLGFFGWFFKFLFFFLDPFFQYLKWFFKTIYKVRVPFLFHPCYFILFLILVLILLIAIYFIWDIFLNYFYFIVFSRIFHGFSKWPRFSLGFFNCCYLLDLLWLINIKLVRNWAFEFSMSLGFNGSRVW